MFEQIRANKIKSTVLVVGLAVLLIGLGYALGEALGPGGGGVFGVLIAMAIWVVMSLVSYFAGDSVMLRMSGARKIEHKDNPQLFNVVEEMAIAAGLPVPEVYLMDDTSPNAFATGRDPEHAKVAITKGLLMKLTRDELQGVMAHEMSHVMNRDILFMTMAGIMVGVIVLLADWYIRNIFWFGGGRRRRSSQGDARVQMIMMVVGIVLAILAPIIARILYLAASRKREYLADASAARLTRYPEGLASALEKIASDPKPLEAANRATAPMYIVNPVKGMAASAGRGLSGLFSTHPPLQDRVAVLRAMGTGAGLSDYQKAFMQLHPGKNVIGKQSLSKAARVELREGATDGPVQEKHEDRAKRVLDAMDTVRRMQNFIFLTCACGVKLKFPAGFKKDQVKCPRCGAMLAVAAAMDAAQGGVTNG